MTIFERTSRELFFFPTLVWDYSLRELTLNFLFWKVGFDFYDHRIFR